MTQPSDSKTIYGAQEMFRNYLIFIYKTDQIF